MQARSQDPNFTAAAGDYVGGMKADLEEEIKAQADAMAEDSTGVDTTLGDDDDELDDLDDDDDLEDDPDDEEDEEEDEDDED